VQRSNDDRERIRTWVHNLSLLVRAGQDGLSADTVAITAEMLIRDDFPASAFNADALHAVAMGNAYFPAYDAIRVALARHWFETRPKGAALPDLSGDVDVTGFSPMDRSWLGFWQKRLSEGFAAVRAGDRPSSAEHVLSLIRQQSPNAFRAIMLSRGVDPEQSRRAPTPDEAERVSDVVRSSLRDVVADKPERPEARHLKPELLAWKASGATGPRVDVEAEDEVPDMTPGDYEAHVAEPDE
jgi:hypothetical protein